MSTLTRGHMHLPVSCPGGSDLWSTRDARLPARHGLQPRLPVCGLLGRGCRGEARASRDQTRTRASPRGLPLQEAARLRTERRTSGRCSPPAPRSPPHTPGRARRSSSRGPASTGSTSPAGQAGKPEACGRGFRHLAAPPRPWTQASHTAGSRDTALGGRDGVPPSHHAGDGQTETGIGPL